MSPLSRPAVALPLPSPAAGPVPAGGDEGEAPPLHLPLAVDDLHPALWRAHQLGQARTAATATGWPELDVERPGGG